MWEWFVLNTYWIRTELLGYSEYFFYVHAANITAVLLVFEYHWQRASTLADDRTTYELFRWFFALVPMASVYLYARLAYQRCDSTSFLADYATKRDF